VAGNGGRINLTILTTVGLGGKGGRRHGAREDKPSRVQMGRLLGERSPTTWAWIQGKQVGKHKTYHSGEGGGKNRGLTKEAADVWTKETPIRKTHHLVFQNGQWEKV